MKKQFPIIALWPIVLIFLAIGLAVRLWLISNWSAIDYTNLLELLIYGLRFDLRWAVIIFLPYWLIVRLTRFCLPSPILKKVAIFLATLILGTYIFIAVVDVYYFDYTQHRLDAYIFSLGQESEAFSFVLSSYPVKTLAFFIVLIVIVIFLLVKKWYELNLVYITQKSASKIHFLLKSSLIFLIAVIALHGRFGQYPIRWSDLHVIDQANAYLGINSLQNLVDTFALQHSLGLTTKEEQLLYENFNLFGDYLELPEKNINAKQFQRELVAPDKLSQIKSKLNGKNLNVIVIILESWSFYQSSFQGKNIIDTTPELRKLAKQGVLFTNFFSNAEATARGVYALLTGLPDVSAVSTASRNPKAISKPLLANQENYDFNYFIGGSVSWANIQALIGSNGRANIIEGKDFDMPSIDVWGISDADLFRGVAAKLKNIKSPFFSVIQTSGNHRPYTIPAHEKNFIRKKFDKTLVQQSGFYSLEALEAVRLMDYSVGVFFDLIKDEDYFDNTIFVLLGDHGVPVHPKRGLSKLWQEQKLDAYHTPLIIYAPKHIDPKVIATPASQVDVVPTLANMIGLQLNSYGLGRDLFEEEYNGEHTVFICNCPKKRILLEDNMIYVELNNQRKVYKIDGELGKLAEMSVDLKNYDSKFHFLANYYLAARYLLMQNHIAKPLNKTF